MKKAKLQTKKEEKEIKVNETYSAKTMIATIIILLVVFGIFYLITTLVVKEEKNEDEKNIITELDSSKITLNHLLDRKESEYFVLALKKSSYPANANYDEIYNKYIEDYSKSENALTFYKVDLDDALNKGYLSDDTNIMDDAKDLKLSDEVLFKIKNGKIENYYVGNSKIVEFLSSLK